MITLMTTVRKDTVKSLIDKDGLLLSDAVYVIPLFDCSEHSHLFIEKQFDAGTRFDVMRSAMYELVLVRLKRDPVALFKELNFREFL